MTPPTHAASSHRDNHEHPGHHGLSASGRCSRKLSENWEEAATKGRAANSRAHGASRLASFTTAVFCILAATATTTTANPVRSDSVQLAEIEKHFSTPREPQDRSNVQPLWFEAWKRVLHNQIDGLLSALAQRPAERGNGSGPGPEPRPELDVGPELGNDFKIAIVGDSTMRMQATVLSWLLMHRDDLTCEGTTSGKSGLRCSRAGSNGEDGGEGLSKRPDLTLSVDYVKALDICQGGNVDADFVYFGCGLRLLQLIPERSLSWNALDTWVHYERLLEQAVEYYRSGGGSMGSRIPVGEAFTTTHSFAEEVLDGPYEVRVREYEEKKESLLTTCRDTVQNITTVHLDWESVYKPEDICTHGTFNDAGVRDLNRRAEPVMNRLGVPMVRGYDITRGQQWATLPQDGRHYPAVIPVELNSFLSEVTTALRIEKRARSGGGL